MIASFFIFLEKGKELSSHCSRRELGQVQEGTF